MKTVIWECDRCHAKVEVPRNPPGTKPPIGWTLPPGGWISNRRELYVEDVCASCITPDERSESVFTDEERTVLEELDFDPDDPPST